MTFKVRIPKGIDRETARKMIHAQARIEFGEGPESIVLQDIKTVEADNDSRVFEITARLDAQHQTP